MYVTRLAVFFKPLRDRPTRGDQCTKSRLLRARLLHQPFQGVAIRSLSFSFSAYRLSADAQSLQLHSHPLSKTGTASTQHFPRACIHDLPPAGKPTSSANENTHFAVKSSIALQTIVPTITPREFLSSPTCASGPHVWHFASAEEVTSRCSKGNWHARRDTRRTTCPAPAPRVRHHLGYENRLPRQLSREVAGGIINCASLRYPRAITAHNGYCISDAADTHNHSTEQFPRRWLMGL